MTNVEGMAFVQGTKAMRGRIALQSTSCETWARSGPYFAQALGVRTRPRVALAGRTCRVPVFMLILLTIPLLSIFGAAQHRSAPQLPGYKAVRVHYGPMNKMIMSVRINGQPSNLLVDTGRTN